MKVRRVGKSKMIRPLPTRALWVSLLFGLLAVAAPLRPGLQTIFAQSTETQAGSPQAVSNAAIGVDAQAAQPDQKGKAKVEDVPSDPRKKQIADDAANLLKLANDLKAEVDKTTPDTMSVPVIRQAEEIEKLAHRMRTK